MIMCTLLLRKAIRELSGEEEFDRLCSIMMTFLVVLIGYPIVVGCPIALITNNSIMTGGSYGIGMAVGTIMYVILEALWMKELEETTTPEDILAENLDTIRRKMSSAIRVADEAGISRDELRNMFETAITEYGKDE